MKKIYLIASLLALTTTQNLLLMELTEQQLESNRQYTNLLIQECNQQTQSVSTLENKIKDSTQNLEALWSEFIQPNTPLPNKLKQIQEIKKQAIELKETLTQSLEIQQGINNNCSILQQAINSPTKLILSEKKPR